MPETPNKTTGQSATPPSASLEGIARMVVENRQALQEIQLRLKRIERLQFVKFLITLFFVVAPIIGAVVVLPRLFNTLLSSYGLEASSVEGGRGVLEVFDQIQGLQEGLDQINKAQ